MSRRILVLAHTGRQAAMTAAQEACTQLHASGLIPVMRRRDLEERVVAGVALAALQQRHEAHGDGAPLGELLLGEAALLAQASDAPGQALEVGACVAGVRGAWAHGQKAA